MSLSTRSFSSSIVLLITCLSSFVLGAIPQVYQHTNLLRTIDLTKPYIRDSTALILENISNATQTEYYWGIPLNLVDHLSYLEVKEKKTGATQLFHVEKALEDHSYSLLRRLHLIVDYYRYIKYSCRNWRVERRFLWLFPRRMSIILLHIQRLSRKMESNIFYTMERNIRHHYTPLSNRRLKSSTPPSLDKADVDYAEKSSRTHTGKQTLMVNRIPRNQALCLLTDHTMPRNQRLRSRKSKSISNILRQLRMSSNWKEISKYPTGATMSPSKNDMFSVTMLPGPLTPALNPYL